jgi:hypothetical protein
MTGCVEVKSEKYQTRKSPAFHAKDCKDLTKKGKDGQYISKADAKGIYKWVKVVGSTRKQKGKFYDTHDNGRRPFRVIVSDDGANAKKVTIYKDANIGTFKESADYSKLIKELTVNEVYVGKSTGKAEGADHSPEQASSFKGNSILLHISGNRYVYVGTEVYEFTMEDKLDEYFSMVGRNDVPYPVLLGTENVYFMIDGDHTYVPRDKFPSTLKKEQWENAYSYYYGWLDPETGKSRTDKERKEFALENYARKMKGFKMIDKRRF